MPDRDEARLPRCPLTNHHLFTTSSQDGSLELGHRTLDRAFWLPTSRESSHFQPPPPPTTTTTTASLTPTRLTDRPPQSLLDEIINSINFLAERALASVETGLLNAPPAQLGFGRPAPEANSANAKSKRKRKKQQQQQQQPEPREDAAPLSPEEVEEQARAEIASGTHQLETLLCTSIDRNFDRFELYVVKNILCVRPEDRDWIRLGHYEGLSFDNLPPLSALPGSENNDDDSNKDKDADAMDVDPPAEDNPDIPTVHSVGRLRRRLQASQKLSTMLVAEKARNDALLSDLRRIAGRATIKPEQETGEAGAEAEAETDTKTKPLLAFLHDRGDLTQADADTPLTTTTAFSLSQMQALRALSTSLSSILPDLRAAPGEAAADDGAAAAGPRTWRKERVEYVEGAARKHLESVRGLELGRDGEVRDGEWQGEGRRFGGGEVGALEGVVEMLDEEPGGGDGGVNEEMEDDGVE